MFRESSIAMGKVSGIAAALSAAFVFAYSPVAAFEQCATASDTGAQRSKAASSEADSPKDYLAAAVDTATAGAKTPDDSSAASAAPAPLRAGVQLIELNLEMLRDLGLDLKNILKASSSLFEEVTIQPVNLMTEPEVVGYATVIQIPIGFTPTGAGPQPKKQRVDAAMAQMRPTIEMLQADVQQFEEGRKRLDISDDERKELKPEFDKWVALVNEISAQQQTLNGLTQTPPYNNQAIANAANDIHQSVKKMDQVRRRIYKHLQKEGKKNKRA